MNGGEKEKGEGENWLTGYEDMGMDVDGLFGMMVDAGFNWQGGLFRDMDDGGG